MPNKRSSSSDELPALKRAKTSSPTQDIMSGDGQLIDASAAELELEATATASASSLTVDNADNVDDETQDNPSPYNERPEGDAHEYHEEVKDTADTSHLGSDHVEIMPSGFEEDVPPDAPAQTFQDDSYEDFGHGHETSEEHAYGGRRPSEEPAPWSPPPEPLRPPIPYLRKQRFTIRSHKACPPFGRDYPDYPGLRTKVPNAALRTKTLVEVCLENPPMEGEALDDPPRTMHILEKIRVKDDGGAQLVACRLNDESQEYVAKIYDPLYYGFNDREFPSDPRDVTYAADHDYSREVAAYLELDDLFGGKLESTPKYYGSWTLQHSLDTSDGRKTRDVRMILMELLEGRIMEDIDPSPYPEDVRLETVAQVLELGRRIGFAGVRHGDFALRNYFLCEDFPAKTIKRTVMLDFNFAVVSRLDNWLDLYGSRGNRKKPSNPINSARNLGFMYSEFRQWLPASWNQEAAPLHRWIHERWGSSEEFERPRRPIVLDDTPAESDRRSEDND